MIPSNIVNKIAASVVDLRKLWGEQMNFEFCGICYGYGFCEDDPGVPILFSERFYTEGTKCPECEAENHYFGDDEEDEEEDSNDLFSPIESPKSMSDILKNFRIKTECVE